MEMRAKNCFVDLVKIYVKMDSKGFTYASFQSINIVHVYTAKSHFRII